MMVTTDDLYGTCDVFKEKIHDTVSHVPGQIPYTGMRGVRSQMIGDDIYGQLVGDICSPAAW